MTKENTEDAVVSSPPAFMSESSAGAVDPAKAEEKVGNGKEAAAKAAAREEAAQDKDAMGKRMATLAKATSRIKELTNYVELIDKAVASTLPEFCSIHSVGEVLDTFILLEDEAKLLEEQVKSLMGRMSMTREVLLPERLDAEQTKTFTAESGNRITRTAKVFASMSPEAGFVPDGGNIVKGNNFGLQPGSYPELIGCPLGFVWLKQNGYESLIKYTVNSSSLSATAKELLGEGKELPEALFRVHDKNSVSITRKKRAA